MTNISHELMLVQNLANASRWHKDYCNKSCDVSLFQLKQAAEFIVRFMRAIGGRESELIEAERIISEMTTL